MLDLVSELGKGESLEAQFEIEGGAVTDFYLLRATKEWTPLELETKDQAWLISRLNPELVTFASNCDSDWDGRGPVPDGAYVFPIDSCELYFELSGKHVVDYEFEIITSNSPAIPTILRIFGFSLSRSAYEQLFEPSYYDLQNDFARSRSIARKGWWASALVNLAFAVRALKIAAECLARDWLCISWRRFVWLIISLIASGGIARWLLGL